MLLIYLAVASASGEQAFRIFASQPEYMSPVDILKLAIDKSGPEVRTSLSQLIEAGGFDSDMMAVERLYHAKSSALAAVVGPGYSTTWYRSDADMWEIGQYICIVIDEYTASLRRRCLNDILPKAVRRHYDTFFREIPAFPHDSFTTSTELLFATQVSFDDEVKIEMVTVLSHLRKATSFHHDDDSSITMIQGSLYRFFIDRSTMCYVKTEYNIHLLPQANALLWIHDNGTVSIFTTTAQSFTTVYENLLFETVIGSLHAFPDGRGFYILLNLPDTRRSIIFTSEDDFTSPRHCSYHKDVPGIKDDSVITTGLFCVPSSTKLRSSVVVPINPESSWSLIEGWLYYKDASAGYVHSEDFVRLVSLHASGDKLTLFFRVKVFPLSSVIVAVKVDGSAFRTMYEVRSACTQPAVTGALVLRPVSGMGKFLKLTCQYPYVSASLVSLISTMTTRDIKVLILTMAAITVARHRATYRPRVGFWTLDYLRHLLRLDVW